MNGSSRVYDDFRLDRSNQRDQTSIIKLQEACYVRALYPFSSTESSSLGFNAGDLIRVLTKLESGWWDGLLRGERGWFPSNYVEEVEIVSSDDEDEEDNNDDEAEAIFKDAESLVSLRTGKSSASTMVTASMMADPLAQDDSVFWIPKATNEGRVYFFNTVTGASQWDLPLREFKHAHVSQVVQNRQTPMTHGVCTPGEHVPDMPDGEISQDDDGYTSSDTQQFLGPRDSYISPRLSSVSNGWKDALGNDILAEDSPGSEDKDSEILLFARPEGRHSSPSRSGGRNTLDTPEQSKSTTKSQHSYPESGIVSVTTQTSLASNISKSVYRETTKSRDLAQWSLRSSAILDSLRTSVDAGATTEISDCCASMRDLVSEMLQTYGMLATSQPAVQANGAIELTGGSNHQRDTSDEILYFLATMMHSSHVASSDWATAADARKLLVDAAALHSTILAYNTNAIRSRPQAKLLHPTALFSRTTAAGWQGNGIGTPSKHHPLPFELCADTVAEMEHYSREILAELRICKSKLRQHEGDTTAISGSVVLRNAMDTLKFVRQMLACCEQIDLSPLDPAAGLLLVRSPTTSDFAKSKQMLYDASGSLMVAAQAMTSLPVPSSRAYAPDNAKNLEYALSDLERAVQAVVMHVEFMVQEHGSRYADNGVEQHESEIILEAAPMRNESGGQRPLEDNLTPASPDLRSSSVAQFSSLTDRVTSSRAASPTENGNLWFLENELESDLSYDSKGNVKAGTLLALVERLTRHDLLDAVYNNTFLLTYRSFTTAEELSGLLRARFMISPPQGLAAAQFDIWVRKKQHPIQLRVFNILKSWMENFFMEPPNDITKEWLTQMKHFVKTVMSESIGSASVLLKLIEMRMAQGDVPFRKLIPSHSGTAPSPIVPRNLKKIRLLDLDALEVARQLTIMESHLYNKIKPTECLDKSWSKPDAADGAENIKAMILHSNQITAWVAEAILYQTDLKKRVNLIKHFVFIAEKCRVLNNFSTLTAIISGLNSAPIHRLRRTWDLLNARVAMSAEDLNRLMNSSKNFSQYREALHSTMPACVPFLGVYLTDLTFIEDGNPNMSVKARHLINFSKRQKTADVIRDIQQYQAVPYSLQAVPEIQNYIRSCMDITRDISELYHISLEREPREREDEKIARLLQESGFL
ncbi:protein of unknown function [Taphrina deformans PYCC 5710]|uniref:Cell division control protein Cdc25 n=1 Tax=Taphrina deformans (strain PYCC 5710 / ATCC 11124 / CBS 356.35 / IMI 108563 / JCM 9778 / NBRC 8474) TaxID=1097556 RepID=R4XGT7_TAPDE|nr:protein of unknown function [Taphrina deformans PYCC 5710]|eukprot:CCG84890.1 protein of unknown function [Taphrina deformans PYCC 5710]